MNIPSLPTLDCVDFNDEIYNDEDYWYQYARTDSIQYAAYK